MHQQSTDPHAINARSDDEGWDLLFYYNLYRFVLALLLMALASPTIGNITSAENLPIAGTIAGFALVSIITFINIKRRSPRIAFQAHLLFLLDIVFIGVLIHSSILHQSSTVVFLITTVAATAVIFRVRTSLAYACLCTAVIYSRDLSAYARGDIRLDDFYLTAYTAIGFFTIVVIVSWIARQLRTAQTTVERQEVELADLDEVNHIVVERLELGVAFLDNDLNLRVINDSARTQIGDYIEEDKLSGRLADLIILRNQSPDTRNFTFRHGNKILHLRSVPLRNGLLLNIEDQTTLNRRIQQTKLSSVGRMATAISHEIRNPLHAINHAAQLLEPNDDAGEDKELISIIRKHVKRIDNIIESVLGRSRPDKVQRQEIALISWLENFIQTFKQTLGEEKLELRLQGNEINVDFDPTQLEQILTNLCQNSLKYARTDDGMVEITLSAGTDSTGGPYLEIMDNGEPIPESQIEHLFEPFYTTGSASTGLGLYLARELCTLNDADIEYFVNISNHGFRISFHPEAAS